MKLLSGSLFSLVILCGFLTGSASAGSLYGLPTVNAPLTNTSQVRTATNNNPYPVTVNAAGVNLYYSGVANGTVSGTLLGVGFDNINIQPAATQTLPLSANYPGVGFTYNFLNTNGVGDYRNQTTSGTITGTDSTTLIALNNHIRYMSAAGDHGTNQLTFTGLPANTSAYIQLIGGDSGWLGVPTVNVNGNLVGNWTTNADGSGSTASIFGFEALTSSTGTLFIDITSTNYTGLAGAIVLFDNTPPALTPEPAAMVLFAMALAGVGLWTWRRKSLAV